MVGMNIGVGGLVCWLSDISINEKKVPLSFFNRTISITGNLIFALIMFLCLFCPLHKIY